MSDPVIRRVRRSIDEARNRGGMQAGMPKVTIAAADAERLCIVAEALTTSKAQNEVLRARVAELSDKAQRLSFAIVHSLTDEQHEPLSSQFADLQDAIVANSSKPWILRKQAEAVEPAIRTALRNLGNADIDESDIAKFAADYAQRLREQAEQIERVGE